MSKENRNVPQAAMTLAVLFTFISASAVLAEANNRTDYPGPLGQRPVSMMSNGRTGVVNDAGKPFTSEKNGLFARSQPDLVQSALFRRGTTSETIVWIKLTEPGGKLIHINLEHVTSVRFVRALAAAQKKRALRHSLRGDQFDRQRCIITGE